MGDRMTCPACGAHLSSVLHAFAEGEPCPSCGLPHSAAVAVLDIRRQRADEDVKRRALEAELRAARAEEELSIARHRLEEVQRALSSLPYGVEADSLRPHRWSTPAGVPLGEMSGDPESPYT
jgi:DNA repair exonuclease SbcCD ATPase subunit